MRLLEKHYLKQRELVISKLLFTYKTHPHVADDSVSVPFEDNTGRERDYQHMVARAQMYPEF